MKKQEFDAKALTVRSLELRKVVLDMIMKSGGGHIGGDFSVMDTLVTLYFDQMNISPENQDDPDRDYFIMSKGHSVESYYAVLAAWSTSFRSSAPSSSDIRIMSCRESR